MANSRNKFDRVKQDLLQQKQGIIKKANIDSQNRLDPNDINKLDAIDTVIEAAIAESRPSLGPLTVDTINTSVEAIEAANYSFDTIDTSTEAIKHHLDTPSAKGTDSIKPNQDHRSEKPTEITKQNQDDDGPEENETIRPR